MQSSMKILLPVAIALGVGAACGAAGGDGEPTGEATDDDTDDGETTGSNDLPDDEGTDTDDTGEDGIDQGSADLPPIPECGLEEGTFETLELDPALFMDGADPSGDAQCTDVKNPERGLYTFVDLRELSQWSIDLTKSEGNTIVYGKVQIDDYRDAPLDDALLDQLDANFAWLRDEGIKVIPRVYYAGEEMAADAPLDRILEHVGQLAPVLESNADVIVALQAGFVGAWGEWHASTNGLDADAPRKEILDALLAALPASRMVQVRRPSFKEAAFGGPLLPNQAYGESDLARIGHHNDCFLASDDDQGTYALPGEWDYAATDSAFVAVGGETCKLNPPRSQCASALAELEALHWSYLNGGFFPGVLDGWKQEGCFDQIRCRLGYRYALTQMRWRSVADPGESASIELSIVNDGYAAPFNERPAHLVLDGPERHDVELALDLREVGAGDVVDLCVQVELPIDLPAGDYRIGLWLPDLDPSLAADPEFSIRVANAIDWDEEAGVAYFGAVLAVE